MCDAFLSKRPLIVLAKSLTFSGIVLIHNKCADDWTDKRKKDGTKKGRVKRISRCIGSGSGPAARYAAR